MNNEHQLIRDLVVLGHAVEYGKISVTRLGNYTHRRQEQFQVHCTHHKMSVSELYNDIDEAIDRYLGLKTVCYEGK